VLRVNIGLHYFGGALNNFGVRELLAGVAELAPIAAPAAGRPSADLARGA
jgi:peptide subunit release factor RF-3